MSDCAGSRYDKKEEFQILLTKNDPIVSPRHKNYLWMARWTKASSSAEPQNDSSCNLLEDLNNNKRTGSKDIGIMTSEFKSTVTERFMVGRGSASVQHSRQFNMRGPVHDVCKEVRPNNYEHGSGSFERHINQRAVNSHAKAVVSETHKISELPLDLQKVGSSDIQSSDWNHFPMFDINRKIDNILKPKRRSALDPASLNVNMSMALSAQEYTVPCHRISDENMDVPKPAGGIVSHLEGPAGLNSDPSRQKLKGHLLDTMSCFCSKDSNTSNCQIDEQHTSHHADSNHELPFASSGKNFPFEGYLKDQSDVSVFHNQKSRRSDFYKQEDAAGDIYRAPILGAEFRKEPTTCSYKSKQGGENFDGTFKSDGKAISSSPYEQQFLKTRRTESAANLNLPDPDANTLTVRNKHMTRGKESTKNSTGSCKRKGPCLYEMLTTAPKSQSACPKNSVSSGNGFDVCMYGTNIGSHLFGTQNQSSARTETLYSDTLVVSKSSAGIASSTAEKYLTNLTANKKESVQCSACTW